MESTLRGEVPLRGHPDPTHRRCVIWKEQRLHLRPPPQPSDSHVIAWANPSSLLTAPPPPCLNASTGVKGPDVPAAAPPVGGGAVPIGPADAGHRAAGAPQPVRGPGGRSGRDRSVRLRGAAAEGVAAGDEAPQLHEQARYGEL